ncbi:MAG: hypothetical protein GWQ08_20185 [Verrucomicrobiaceae bacterium]|nr:hypothetical protein [Verrucomicrobiaceae bacterium]
MPIDPNVKSCLEKLQQAQGIINEAASDLSAVDGFADEWSKVCGLYDSVKEIWYVVDERRIALQDPPPSSEP